MVFCLETNCLEEDAGIPLSCPGTPGSLYVLQVGGLHVQSPHGSELGNRLVALNFKPSAELKGWYATIKNEQPTISDVWAESHEKG